MCIRDSSRSCARRRRERKVENAYSFYRSDRLERSHAEESIRREIGHDLLADELLQRLAGAATQRPVARPAIEARHRVLVGEAVAAVNLDRLAGDAYRHLVAVDLCIGCLVRI